MRFNRHFRLQDRHALLSPSSNSWLRYDEDKMVQRFYSHQAAKRGTDLHALAHDLINLGVRLPDTNDTLSMYVNDCLDMGMLPEVHLYYSENCFGQADAISFDGNLLRISDYKSGFSEASMAQLEVYAALFCLEYDYKPFQIRNELRIYQDNQIHEYESPADSLVHIIDKITSFDSLIESLKGV